MEKVPQIKTVIKTNKNNFAKLDMQINDIKGIMNYNF